MEELILVTVLGVLYLLALVVVGCVILVKEARKK
jgi:hypothetical protein